MLELHTNFLFLLLLPFTIVKQFTTFLHITMKFVNYDVTEYFCVTRVHNMSKELKFSLVKSFISKQTFWLLYSSLHQCNAMCNYSYKKQT